ELSEREYVAVMCALSRQTMMLLMIAEQCGRPGHTSASRSTDLTSGWDTEVCRKNFSRGVGPALALKPHRPGFLPSERQLKGLNFVGGLGTGSMKTISRWGACRLPMLFDDSSMTVGSKSGESSVRTAGRPGTMNRLGLWGSS